MPQFKKIEWRQCFRHKNFLNFLETNYCLLKAARNLLLAKVFDCWFTLLLGGSTPLVLSAVKGRAEAMRRACLVASISVTRAGTQSAYPAAEEVPSELLP